MYDQIGRVDAAIAALETAIAAAPTQRSVVAALGHAYARAGRRREARSIADEFGLHSADGYAYDLSIVWAGLCGDDEALDCLERAYRDRLPWLAWVAVDPRFDRLRRDQRFAALVARLGLAGRTGD